jgi:invasion protein IalB
MLINLCKTLVIAIRKCHCIFFSVALVFFMPQAFGFEIGSSTIGAWNLKCEAKADTLSEICIANQLITTGKSDKQVILGVMVGYLSEHELPHIIFRISAKANIDRGAAVKIDKFDSFSVPISNCDKQVCEVRSFIPEALLSQMRNGKLLRFAFLLDNKPVTYPVSLEGFNKTYSILQNSLK